MKKDFHACATCIHFYPRKLTEGLKYECKRLGFETKPNYKFDCWDPKPHVRKLIAKQQEGFE